MNNKQQKLLQEIKDYYQETHMVPTIRFLQKKLNYKSTKSIYTLLQDLEKNGYIKKINHKYLLTNEIKELPSNIVTIDIINSEEKLFLNINPKKNYLAFIIKNNDFINNYILKNDLLVIEKKKKLQNNDLGLFIINQEYRIMKYSFQDGFYVLYDHEFLILNKIKLVGKVIMVIRK